VFDGRRGVLAEAVRIAQEATTPEVLEAALDVLWLALLLEENVWKSGSERSGAAASSEVRGRLDEVQALVRHLANGSPQG
jgi:hypothetical protein